MTKEELEYIQAACRDWLQQPGAATSRTIIPAAGPLSRSLEVARSGILTFDNVLITSAVDVETGVCYTKLIEQPDGVSEFFDSPLEKIEPSSTPTLDSKPSPMRATQKRYHDAMKRVAEERPDDRPYVELALASYGFHSEAAELLAYLTDKDPFDV